MPLPKETLTAIHANLKLAEAKMTDLEANVRDAQRAGIVDQDLNKQIADTKASIRKLRQVYG